MEKLLELEEKNEALHGIVLSILEKLSDIQQKMKSNESIILTSEEETQDWVEWMNVDEIENFSIDITDSESPILNILKQNIILFGVLGGFITLVILCACCYSFYVCYRCWKVSKIPKDLFDSDRDIGDGIDLRRRDKSPPESDFSESSNIFIDLENRAAVLEKATVLPAYRVLSKRETPEIERKHKEKMKSMTHLVFENEFKTPVTDKKVSFDAELSHVFTFPSSRTNSLNRSKSLPGLLETEL